MTTFAGTASTCNFRGDRQRCFRDSRSPPRWTCGRSETSSSPCSPGRRPRTGTKTYPRAATANAARAAAAAAAEEEEEAGRACRVCTRPTHHPRKLRSALETSNSRGTPSPPRDRYSRHAPARPGGSTHRGAGSGAPDVLVAGAPVEKIVPCTTRVDSSAPRGIARAHAGGGDGSRRVRGGGATAR